MSAAQNDNGTLDDIVIFRFDSAKRNDICNPDSGKIDLFYQIYVYEKNYLDRPLIFDFDRTNFIQTLKHFVQAVKNDIASHECFESLLDCLQRFTDDNNVYNYICVIVCYNTKLKIIQAWCNLKYDLRKFKVRGNQLLYISHRSDEKSDVEYTTLQIENMQMRCTPHMLGLEDFLMDFIRQFDDESNSINMMYFYCKDEFLFRELKPSLETRKCGEFIVKYHIKNDIEYKDEILRFFEKFWNKEQDKSIVSFCKPESIDKKDISEKCKTQNYNDFRLHCKNALYQCDKTYPITTFDQVQLAFKDISCRNLVFWTQYEETCWFNALLVSMFYSQFSRLLLLTKMKESEKGKITQEQRRYVANYITDIKQSKKPNSSSFSDGKHQNELTLFEITNHRNISDISMKKLVSGIMLFNIFDYVLKYKYMQSNKFVRYFMRRNPQSFFKDFSPSYILKLLHNYDKEWFYIEGEKGKQGGNASAYIRHLYNFLDVDCLMILGYKYYAELVCIYDFMNYTHIEEDCFLPSKIGENLKMSFTTELQGKPSVIIISLRDNILYGLKPEQKNALHNTIKLDQLTHYHIKDTNITAHISALIDPIPYTSTSIIEYSFEYNQNKYILDSIIISNWNENNETGHTICIIRCHGKMYIYNGQVKYISGREQMSEPLIEWEDKMDFFLDFKKGEIRFIKTEPEKKDIKNPNLYFYSYSKGNRQFVYIKESDIDEIEYDSVCKIKDVRSLKLSDIPILDKPQKSESYETSDKAPVGSKRKQSSGKL